RQLDAKLVLRRAPVSSGELGERVRSYRLEAKQPLELLGELKRCAFRRAEGTRPGNVEDLRAVYADRIGCDTDLKEQIARSLARCAYQRAQRVDARVAEEGVLVSEPVGLTHPLVVADVGIPASAAFVVNADRLALLSRGV